MIKTADSEAMIAEAKRDFRMAVFAALSEQNISQNELGRRAGMQPQNLSQRLNGPKRTTIHTFCRIAHALGYKVRIRLERIEDK